MIQLKKDLIYLAIIFLVFAFFINSVSALTANSSNYSVSMFGTAMATADPSSTNYEAESLSLPQPGTRNAESDSHTVNIGFFNNTAPYQTVSITSYSTSPTSAVVGSTISLYISALNPQSVWAKITYPNSQEQTVTLVNNALKTYSPPSVVGTYTVTFYANSSTGALASAIDSFALTAQTTTPSGGGGSSTTTIIEQCTYHWDCTPWGVCVDGKQTRKCKNIGTCNGTENKPIEEMSCSKALFDVILKLKNIELTKNKTLKFSVDLTEKMGVEKIDVQIKYSILNEKGYEIFSQIKTIAVQKNLSYEKEIEEINLKDGEYKLMVEVLYGNLQRAFAEQKVRIVDGKIETGERKTGFLNYLSDNLNVLIIILIGISIIIPLFIYERKRNLNIKHALKNKIKSIFNFIMIVFGIIALGFGLISCVDILNKSVFSVISEQRNFVLLGIFILIIVFVLIRLIMRKKKVKKKSGIEHKRKIRQNLKRIMSKNHLAILLSFIAMGFLFTARKSITGFVIEDSIIKNSGWNLFEFILVVGMLGLLTFLYKIKIKSFIIKAKEGIKSKHSKNSVFGLMKKKVYTDRGEYIGNIEEIILLRNKIESLKIKLGKIVKKKNKTKNKGIFIKYNNVQSMGNIVIINKGILEYLKKSK